MRTAVIGVLFLLFPFPAIAEVCDKVRPSWNPTGGRVGQLEELYFFFTSYVGIGLIALIFCAL